MDNHNEQLIDKSAEDNSSDETFGSESSERWERLTCSNCGFAHNNVQMKSGTTWNCKSCGHTHYIL